MLSELAEGNESLIGRNSGDQLEKMRAIARILDRLLVGLIPITARILDYKSIVVGGREALVHNAILENNGRNNRNPKDVYLVATLDRELFWKDIRRLLFSDGRFRVFGRIAHTGLLNSWQPVKGVDVLSGLTGDFERAFREFGELAKNLPATFKENRPAGRDIDLDPVNEILHAYLKQLCEIHGMDTDSEVNDLLLEIVPGGRNWLNTVDERRSVFKALNDVFDRKAGVETSPDTRMAVRKRVLAASGLDALTPRIDQSVQPDGRSPDNNEMRYLECDVVAIYW